MSHDHSLSTALALYSVLLSVMGNFITEVDILLSVAIKVIPLVTCFFYFLINIDKIIEGAWKFISLFKRKRNGKEEKEKK